MIKIGNDQEHAARTKNLLCCNFTPMTFRPANGVPFLYIKQHQGILWIIKPKFQAQWRELLAKQLHFLLRFGNDLFFLAAVSWLE